MTLAPPPRFVTGSPLRHVVVMASTGAIGLVAVFVVDLINLFYISRLGEQAIAAAIITYSAIIVNILAIRASVPYLYYVVYTY